VQLRWRLLNRMLADLARAGVPLSTPEALSETHVDTLMHLWQTSGRMSADSVKNNQRLLARLCRWLDQPELALRVKGAGPAARPPAPPPEPFWPEAESQARLAAIRGQDARLALHVELVRTIGLTHRQAALWQRRGADQAGFLDVIWETPKEQVLRFPLTTEGQRAVVAEAHRLLQEPDESVCPAGVSVSTWLRKVYDLLRQVGGIGVPGGPRLAELKAPDAPSPIILDRETYFIARAGWRAPQNRPR